MSSIDPQTLPPGVRLVKVPCAGGLRIPKDFKDGFARQEKNENRRLMRIKIDNDKHTATAYYFDGTSSTYDLKN